MAVDKPVIVVVHATSKQGTSVVNSLLWTDKYVVKAITRDASGNSALLATRCSPTDHSCWPCSQRTLRAV